MNRCANLSREQRRVQQIIDQFNADEQLWASLGSKRRRRRKLHPGMPAKVRKQLDLLEFAAARPTQDCIGFPQGKNRSEGLAPSI
jgi:hypothetical protein